MKKNNLFKIIGIVLIFILIGSWVIPINGVLNPVGLFKIISYLSETFTYNEEYLLIAFYLLVVGGFYGVVNKTGAYQNLIKKIALKFRKNEKKVIVFTMIFFSVLNSISGGKVILFLFVPLVISVLLYIGFDKITVFISTFGALLVGMVGSIYNREITGMILNVLNLELVRIGWFNLIILFIGTGLLIMYALKSINKNKILKKEIVEDKLLFEEKKSSKATKGLSIIFIILFIIMLLGMTNWTGINEKFTFFETITNNLLDVKINDFYIFSSLLGIKNSFGRWWYSELITVVLLAILVIKFIYKIKINELFTSFMEGAKKLLPAALLVIFLSLLTTILNRHDFILSINQNIISSGDKFNGLLVGLVAVLGSSFNNLVETLNIVNEHTLVYSLRPLVGIMFQYLYGIIMFITPTSVLLIIGLNYLEIEYVTWLKHIFDFIIKILLVVLLVFFILLIIV